MDSTENNTTTDSQQIANKMKKKESQEESEIKINMNPWGMTFMILFVALLGYILVGAMASIPPFIYNVITEEYDIMEGLLTAIIVLALVSLALGIYFGWMRKPKESEEEEKEEDEVEEHKVDRESEQQITFVYIKDKKPEE